MYARRDLGHREMVGAILERIGAEEDPGVVEDVARYGADAGWLGFIYTTECVEFYERHSRVIDEMLAEDADEFGYANIPAFVASFQRADMASTGNGYRNLLAWYALERVCRDFADGVEDLSDYLEIEESAND